jgi:hypothetical protein
VNHEKLKVKMERAYIQSMDIKALGDFNLRKALLREK